MNTALLSGIVGVIFCAVFLGGVFPLYFRWVEKSIHLGLAFSAGIMLGVAFLHLMPEAFALAGPKAGMGTLLGFLLLYVMEKVMMVHACQDLQDDCEVHHVGIPAFIGLSLHAFTDGLAIGAGSLLSELAWVIAFAVLLHKLPSAFALTTLLLRAHYRKAKILVLQGIFFLTIPLGIMVARFWASGETTPQLGFLLAFAAGTFIHIAFSDILPELHLQHHRRFRYLIFFLF